MGKNKIPIWIYLFQGLLCLILAQQAFSYYQFDYWGEIATTNSEKRELLELAGRTLAMFLIGVIVMISRNPHYFVVLFILNIVRETNETFVDTIYETDKSPIVNVVVHLVVIALEVWALIKAYKVSKAQANQ
ncbi:MAG TPA: hypothetical protein DDY18_07430 [Flavobacterium sp.]|nr:hypothetical protein [Flavobacterium sp.]